MLFKRHQEPESPPERGPLYPAVRDAIVEAQAYARTHGGRIDLVDVTNDGEVRVRLSGTCRGCPLSGITLKVAVEQQLKILVPGIRSVVQVK